jgi:transcriptional regulator with XRE-family HTH domain
MAWHDSGSRGYGRHMKTERNEALVALGRQIRKVRQSRGISQEDFAAEAGLGRSYYGGVERGERNVSALNLMRIAAALHVEVGELFPTVETIRGPLSRSGEPEE